MIGVGTEQYWDAARTWLLEQTPGKIINPLYIIVGSTTITVFWFQWSPPSYAFSSETGSFPYP